MLGIVRLHEKHQLIVFVAPLEESDHDRWNATSASLPACSSCSRLRWAWRAAPVRQQMGAGVHGLRRLNLFQFGITNFARLAIILKKLGVREGVSCSALSAPTPMSEKSVSIALSATRGLPLRHRFRWRGAGAHDRRVCALASGLGPTPVQLLQRPRRTARVTQAAVRAAQVQAGASSRSGCRMQADIGRNDQERVQARRNHVGRSGRRGLQRTSTACWRSSRPSAPWPRPSTGSRMRSQVFDSEGARLAEPLQGSDGPASTQPRRLRPPAERAGGA